MSLLNNNDMQLFFEVNFEEWLKLNMQRNFGRNEEIGNLFEQLFATNFGNEGTLGIM